MANILVVEDSKSMREVISHTLLNAGHTVDTAVDGNDGEQKAQQQRFDMVISDLYMPGKNGISLISALREQENYKSVPIILVTTEDADVMKQKSREVGANGWVTKPINATRLLTAVSKTLEKFNIN